MPQDAFTLRYVVKETADIVTGGKISKILQPDRDSILFYIYTARTTYKLLLSTNASCARLALTKAEYAAGGASPNFCMLLRKYLTGAVVTGVTQLGFERVIAISLHCLSDFTEADRVLYLEVMGKYSNAVLTENGVILGALKMTSLEENYKRILFAGAKYSLPAPQDKVNPFDGDLDGLVSTLPQGDLGEFLFLHVSGIARPTANRIAQTYSGGDLAAHIRTYLFEGEAEPCVLYRDGIPCDFFAKRMPGAVPAKTLSEAQDAFYIKKESDKAFEDRRRKLSSVIRAHKKKEEKKLALLIGRLRECDDAEENRKKGELITANLYALRKGMRECEAIDYYDETCPTVRIPLDETLSPAENAQRYYKKYAKQKRTVAAVRPQTEETMAELDYAESVLSAIERANSPLDLTEIEEELIDLGLIRFQGKKRKEVVTPFRTYEKEGFRILAGRNNRQNDRLLKTLRAGDLWLHTQKYHSSHVGILSEGRPVPMSVIGYAAQICARYSDGGKGGKVLVDYCDRRFVKKPSGANPGFVVYTDYHSILVEPLIEP
ncbi:MAG: NFACT family protein [Christensenellaceae bacterium]